MPADRGRYPSPAVALPSPPASLPRKSDTFLGVIIFLYCASCAFALPFFSFVCRRDPGGVQAAPARPGSHPQTEGKRRRSYLQDKEVYCLHGRGQGQAVGLLFSKQHCQDTCVICVNCFWLGVIKVYCSFYQRLFVFLQMGHLPPKCQHDGDNHSALFGECQLLH